MGNCGKEKGTQFCGKVKRQNLLSFLPKTSHFEISNLPYILPILAWRVLLFSRGLKFTYAFRLSQGKH